MFKSIVTHCSVSLLVFAAARFATAFQGDGKDWQAAKAQLEAIRLKSVTLVDGKIIPGIVGKEYAAAFQKMGFDVKNGNVPAVAAQIKQSPIRKELLAALDHWASALPSNSLLLKRLLEISKRVDPDPWRDQVRDAQTWGDQKKLLHLAASAQVEQQSPQILCLLAAKLQAQGQTPAAAELLRKAWFHHLQDFMLNFQLGSVVTNPLEQAGYFKVALSLQPASATAYNNLGTCLMATGDLDGARTAFHKAVALEPIYPHALNNLGVLLHRKKDFDGAISCYQKALAMDPNYAIAHTNLGAALKDKGDLDGAIAAHKKAIMLDPKNAKAHNNLGLALKDKGDLDGAIDSYRAALALAPTDAAVHTNLGTAFAAKGMVNDAIASFRQAIMLNPKYAVPHNALGLALKQKGDLPAAVASFQKALLIDPNYAEARKNLEAMQKKE